MKLIRVQNEEEGGKKAFELIQLQLKEGATTFGLATGSTPETLYQLLATSDIDFSDKISINLDEYVGLGADNPQSYHFFMNQKLFQYKPFQASYLPDGQATDLSQECEDYDQLLEAHPIDVQILGIGQNGHIGFNEPGSSFTGKTQVVELTESTIQANKRYFEREEDVPTRAISMGIGSIIQSKTILLMAFGEKKAEVIYQMIHGEVTTALPASILQTHPNVFVILDEAAAKKL